MSAPAGHIRLRGAAFGYRGQAVVSGVDLDLEPGSFVGVFGPNGAGKTTLFRGILGLLAPLDGDVERVGVRPGYVPQREGLDAVFPLTVAEVIALGGQVQPGRFGRLHPEVAERVESSLEAVGLGDQRRRPFSSLSGGQRQRALLARALVADPNVLLLDEPTSGVDAPTQERLLELLSAFCERGRSVLLVSHSLSATLAAVERVIWVADGRARALEGEEADRLGRLQELFGVSSVEAGA